jgi:hypothetical protein
LDSGSRHSPLGLCCRPWTLFPSLRESTLSGRTTSIGSLYLAQLKTSLEGFDLKSFFGLLFQEVGGNNAREIQPLTAFFFPTVNYLWSPLLRGTTSNHYDSWTSSLFVYTPFLILFFTALVSSIRRKKVSHLVAFALCCYLLFTNFAYFFFYAFTGTAMVVGTSSSFRKSFTMAPKSSTGSRKSRSGSSLSDPLFRSS